MDSVRGFWAQVGLLCCIALIITITSCINNQDDNDISIVGPLYYKRFAFNYSQMPFQPMEQISEKEAKTLKTYCVAYFTKSGKIISFAKYLHRKLEFSHKYTYDKNGFLEKAETTKSTGEVKIKYFDKKGKIIKEFDRDNIIPNPETPKDANPNPNSSAGSEQAPSPNSGQGPEGEKK